MTLKTLTMARNGGLVIVSALVFGETITTLEGIGYTGLLGCFACYTYVKATESMPPPATSEQELKALVPIPSPSRGGGDEEELHPSPSSSRAPPAAPRERSAASKC